MLYRLAEHMNKRIPEMMQMSIEEYLGWIAYHRLMDKHRPKGTRWFGK